MLGPGVSRGACIHSVQGLLCSSRAAAPAGRVERVHDEREPNQALLPPAQVLSKTMDSTTLTPEKAELATISRDAETGQVRICRRGTCAPYADCHLLSCHTQNCFSAGRVWCSSYGAAAALHVPLKPHAPRSRRGEMPFWDAEELGCAEIQGSGSVLWWSLQLCVHVWEGKLTWGRMCAGGLQGVRRGRPEATAGRRERGDAEGEGQ
jgi:hypothetical protein